MTDAPIPFRNLAGGSHTRGAPRRRPPCSAPPVGGGLRPAPLGECSFSVPISVISGTFPPPRRGGPVCPPGHASSRDLFAGRHIGRPLRIRSKTSINPEKPGGDGAPPLPVDHGAQQRIDVLRHGSRLRRKGANPVCARAQCKAPPASPEGLWSWEEREAFDGAGGGRGGDGVPARDQ